LLFGLAVQSPLDTAKVATDSSVLGDGTAIGAGINKDHNSLALPRALLDQLRLDDAADELTPSPVFLPTEEAEDAV
jgi:hypothetical protein